MKYLISVFLTFISLSSLAATYQGGTFKVQSLRFEANALTVRFNPAPVACEGGDKYPMHTKVENTHENDKELTSALLAAYTAGQTFQYLWFSNEGTRCSNAHILNLDMVEFSYK